MTYKQVARSCFTIMLIGLATAKVNGQISFSPVETKLQTNKNTNELTCSSLQTTVKFPIKRKVKVLPQNNLVVIDSQAIQIMLLKFDGYAKDTKGENLNNQKELLKAYSNYELGYFKNDLGIEVINPNNQWTVSKSKGWFIWYFRVGKVPAQVDTKTEIQLFATTVIEDKILIINAPIMTGGNFSGAAQIVNDMMESLIIKAP